MTREARAMTCAVCPFATSCWAKTIVATYCGKCGYVYVVPTLGTDYTPFTLIHLDHEMHLFKCEGMTPEGIRRDAPRPRHLDILHDTHECPHCACIGSRTYHGIP